MPAGDDGQTILREAIARNSAAVLSLPSAGMLRHHRSRFLADEGEAFWIESVPADRGLVDELIGTQKPVAVSFKSGVQTVSLATPVRRRDPAYKVNNQTTVEAILLAFPAGVRMTQRRGTYRVKIRPEDEMSVRIWRVAELAHLTDVPMDAQEVVAKIQDVSLGGFGVLLSGADGGAPKISTEDRLRVELSFRGAKLLLEGRMRKPSGVVEPGPKLRTGVQFKALESDLQGRQKLAQLTRMVGELQREEIRRNRLSVA